MVLNRLFGRQKWREFYWSNSNSELTIVSRIEFLTSLRRRILHSALCKKPVAIEKDVFKLKFEKCQFQVKKAPSGAFIINKASHDESSITLGPGAPLPLVSLSQGRMQLDCCSLFYSAEFLEWVFISNQM